LIDAADFGVDEWGAECRLVLESSGDELRRREIHNDKHQEAEAGGTPVDRPPRTGSNKPLASVVSELLE
jgi:hypothetical protein